MIDYDALAEAKHFYSEKGFTYIEVPWLVSSAVSDMTRPDFALEYVVLKGGKRKVFVASGEQGFLYLISKGHLPDGKYQTITPCIRNDDFSDIHVKYFMKLELIDLNPTDPNLSLDLIVSYAIEFFGGMCDSHDLSYVKTDEGWDIQFRGIELGSYGIRQNTLCRWVYATGLAEPRFSRSTRTRTK